MAAAHPKRPEGYWTDEIVHGHGVWFKHLRVEPISDLAEYGGIILTVALVVIILFRLYLFEPFLPRLYKSRWAELSELNRRSFLNHHIAATTKIVLLLGCAYPFMSIASGKGTAGESLFGDSTVTLGDTLIIASEIFVAMYVFELCYRIKVSPISTAHHLGALLIAQTAVTLTLKGHFEEVAFYEFILCFIWGTFDVLAELLPHLSMIVYRIYPTNHLLLAKIFLAVCIVEACSTTIETGLVMWLFASVWSQWTLAFKVATPILHTLFSAAQLFGVYVFWKLRQSELRKWKESSSMRRSQEDVNNECRRATVVDHDVEADGKETCITTIEEHDGKNSPMSSVSIEECSIEPDHSRQSSD